LFFSLPKDQHVDRPFDIVDPQGAPLGIEAAAERMK